MNAGNGKSEKQIGEECKDPDSDASKHWCVSVFAFEARKDNRDPAEVDGYVAPASASGPVAEVKTTKSIETQITIHVSNFWPEEELKANIIEYEQEQLQMGLDHFGTSCLGMIRPAKDDPDILPRRVNPIKQVRGDGGREDTVLDRSTDHLFE